MSRAYIRFSPRTFHEKVVIDGYPPGAFAAFAAVLCMAEEQPERGRFRSERLLRLLLDEPEDGVHVGWGKWVKYLLEHGDLVKQDRGVLYVVGWDEWQEGDFTVAERMRRMRQRRRNKRNGVTPAPSPNRSGVTTDAITKDQGSLSGVSDSEPLPPPSGATDEREPKLNPRALGTNPRAIAAALTRANEEAAKGRRSRVQARYLAYSRGQITEAQRLEMDERDAPLTEISYQGVPA